MKKLIVLFVMVIGLSMTAMAQEDGNEGKFKFSAGGELGFISGTNKNHASFGIGGNAQVEYFFSDNISGTVIGGFNVYAGKEIENGGGANYGNLTIIPLKVGARYYFFEGFYAGTQLGVGFISGPFSATSFAYSPLIGYSLKINDGKSAIDVSLKYDGYAFGEVTLIAGSNNYVYGGSLGAIGVRLAYVF